MNQQKKIVIECHADGRTNLEAVGFQGNSCQVATRQIEMALAGGAGNTDSKPKPEFYAQNPSNNMMRR